MIILASSHMKYIGSCAKELEILAIADFFNIDIYTYVKTSGNFIHMNNMLDKSQNTALAWWWSH